jgi:hypothetical protein
VLAKPGAVPFDQRGHDADGAEERGEVGGDGDRAVGGHGVVPPVGCLTGTRAAVARGGVHDALPGPHAGARVVRGEARQRQVHEPGGGVPESFPAKAEARHHAGPEVLDEHVGARREAVGDVEVAGVGEVEGDAPLAPVEERVGGACRRLAARRVDVDDVGALVGEHDRHQRPRHVVPEVDDPDAFQRTGHGASSVHSGR